MRYVVRPRDINRTPKRLCRELGYERTYAWPNRQVTPQFDYNQDLLIAVPQKSYVDNAPEEYDNLRKLYVSNKWQQRLWLHQRGYKTPLCVEDSLLYVRRPLYHTRGSNFLVVDSESPIPTQDLIAANNAVSGHQSGSYLSPLFKRTHEYRIILHKGKVVATILKHSETERDQLSAWNADEDGTTYITVRNPANNRLRHTDVYNTVCQDPVLKTAHLLCLDVLLNYSNRNPTQSEYAICEFNFCPQVAPANIEEFRNAVQG